MYSSTQITHFGKLGQVTPFWQVIVAIFSLWCTTCTFFPHNSLTYSDTVEKIASLKLCPGNECLAKAQNPVYSLKVAPDNALNCAILIISWHCNSAELVIMVLDWPSCTYAIANCQDVVMIPQNWCKFRASTFKSKVIRLQMTCCPLAQGGAASREQLQKPFELWAKLWKSSTHAGGAQRGGGWA